MSLSDLVSHATDKERFHAIEHYIDFCSRYLEYVNTGLQARIVSQNESHYQFFQCGILPDLKDGASTLQSRRLSGIEPENLPCRSIPLVNGGVFTQTALIDKIFQPA